jgi:hypothetical protein
MSRPNDFSFAGERSNFAIHDRIRDLHAFGQL